MAMRSLSSKLVGKLVGEPRQETPPAGPGWPPPGRLDPLRPGMGAGPAKPLPADGSHLPDGAWTRRRFLGALVASAVAAGVKVPGIPAAEQVGASTLWGYAGARLEVEHYFLVIRPNVWDLIKIDWTPSPGSTEPGHLEVTRLEGEVGCLEGARVIDRDNLDAALVAMEQGHIRPVTVAVPLAAAPWREI
jgi:hypothetical protein